MSAAREPGTGAEGALRLEVGWDGEAVQTVRVASTRPLAVRRLLEGIEPAEMLRRVSLLYAVCAEAQTAAATAAIAAARGQDLAPSEARASELRVAGESAHEHLFHVLVGLPGAIGGATDSQGLSPLSRMRSAMREAPADGGACAVVLREALTERVFGMAAAEWQEMDALEELDHWLDAGGTSVARLLRGLREWNWPAATVEAMPCASRDEMLGEIVPGLESDPLFPNRPHWRGRVLETGAFARTLAAPFVAAARGTRRSAVLTHARPARGLAGLPSIERLGSGDGTRRIGSPGASGNRPRWVSARGRPYMTQINSGRIARHMVARRRNFHPAALCRQAGRCGCRIGRVGTAGAGARRFPSVRFVGDRGAACMSCRSPRAQIVEGRRASRLRAREDGAPEIGELPVSSAKRCVSASMPRARQRCGGLRSGFRRCAGRGLVHALLGFGPRFGALRAVSALRRLSDPGHGRRRNEGEGLTGGLIRKRVRRETIGG